ncbi:MAG: hypothetical protein JSS82_10560 [Bacteroidetes bacterium]|nr:hypothetical protein [Bacteroidota bacterium]
MSTHGYMKMTLQKLLLIICAIAISMGCKKQKPYKSPPGYDLSKPVMIELPGELNEISGMAYYPPDNSILAECDGKGCIYKISLANLHKITKWKFGKGKDYEDMLVLDSAFYMLHSKGEIVKVTFDATGNPKEESFSFADSAENEFEAEYYDSASRNIVVLCKKCAGEQATAVPSYAFDPKTGKSQLWKNLNLDEIVSELDADKKVKLKPSATAVHPVTGDLYIVSSIDKAIVIADRNYNARKIFHLNPGYFKQPEGIAFTPGGDMFISNEGADIGNANILFFRYKNEKQK